MNRSIMLAVVLLALAAGPLLSQPRGAVSIAVLFDLTASVALDAEADRATLSAFELGFLAHLLPADRVRIGFIADRPSLGATYSSDPKVLLQAARQSFEAPPAARVGPSPIWDAVKEAVESLAPEAGRRAIVLHSDGLSTGGRLWRADVIHRAATAGVSITVIAPPGFKADAQLADAAKRTGGKYLLGYVPNGRGDNKAALRAAFTTALEQLHEGLAAIR